LLDLPDQKFEWRYRELLGRKEIRRLNGELRCLPKFAATGLHNVTPNKEEPKQLAVI